MVVCNNFCPTPASRTIIFNVLRRSALGLDVSPFWWGSVELDSAAIKAAQGSILIMQNPAKINPCRSPRLIQVYAVTHEVLRPVFAVVGEVARVARSPVLATTSIERGRACLLAILLSLLTHILKANCCGGQGRGNGRRTLRES